MTKIVRIHKTGGPEVMELENAEIPAPGAGEVAIRHDAIGLNFIDTYFRSGLYPAPNGLPLTPGNEGAGTVIAVGDGVTELTVGDRVAYAGPIGAYASERVITAERLVKVPDGIDTRTAAGMMLKGMTAEYLLRRTFSVQPGQTILFHAAAGGVGLIVCQWAKALGATVIGTVGSDEKAALAKAHGCDHPIVYTREKFAERVKELTVGEGVAVVYDSIGKDTYMDSLSCLRPFGLLALFGAASGPVPLFDLGLLAKMGSLFITRPTLFTYIAKRADLAQTAGELFEVVGSGKVKIEVNQRYALKDAAKAQTDLEARKTTGSTILLP